VEHPLIGEPVLAKALAGGLRKHWVF
jgi:hypothetical protein